MLTLMRFIPRNYAVIGENRARLVYINRFILLLDGSRQQTDILTRRPLRF